VSSFDRTMTMTKDIEVIETSIQHLKMLEVLCFILPNMALLGLSIKQLNKIKFKSFIHLCHDGSQSFSFSTALVLSCPQWPRSLCLIFLLFGWSQIKDL
jgi:hypothetical protein